MKMQKCIVCKVFIVNIGVHFHFTYYRIRPSQIKVNQECILIKSTLESQSKPYSQLDQELRGHPEDRSSLVDPKSMKSKEKLLIGNWDNLINQ